MKKILISVLVLIATIQVQAQTNKFSTYYNQRITLFEQLPDTPGEIVFLGNSITDGCEWAELLANNKVKNRGISGDTTEGVLFRLDQIIKLQPAKVFLLIGINDLSRDVPADTVYSNITRIVERLKTSSPKTKVYVQSILPVNNTFSTFKKHTDRTEDVLYVNKLLTAWCEDNNIKFIDLFSRFRNTSDYLLNPAYTNDGLHLTGDGYVLWAEIIRPYL